MPGISFETKKEEIGNLNLGQGCLWGEVISQANLWEEFENSIVGCAKDLDGECRRKGCLQEKIAVPLLDREKLLRIHERSLNWFENHPDFKPEEESLREFVRVESLNPAKNKIEKITYVSAFDVAKRIFTELCDALRKSNEKEVSMVNVCNDSNLIPCVREITIGQGEPKKVRILWNVLVDWEYAKKNKEKIKKIQDESWICEKKPLTKKELLERGIKLVDES